MPHGHYTHPIMPATAHDSAAPASAPFAHAAVPDAWLAQSGLRRTRATRAVLQLFVADATRSVTHAELETELVAQGMVVNRVTLYRLLDRLVATGLLSRHADDVARTWRYALASRVSAGPQARKGEVVPRFECDACHRQFHLAEASPPTQAVAEQLLQTLASLGHHGQRVDMSIHGTCNVCVDPPEGNPETAA